MTYRVRLTPEAERQLDAAMSWYAEQDHDVAMEWYLGFRAVIGKLGENPQIHGLSHESEALGEELRDLLYGSGRKKTHRAIFRIVGKTVEVIAIRHFAQQDLTLDDL